jgi:hypothetical protein
MIRKFNYTGRKKINRTNIEISLFGDDKLKQFDAEIKLDDLNLPSNASVYIEPYYHFSFMRFKFGTVEKISPPNETLITEIPFSDILYFRIKVVDEIGKHGQLLAYADKIKPISSEDGHDKRKSLLPVRFSTPLRYQPYRLIFAENSPILEISKNISNQKDLLKSKEFASLVFPSIVKEIAAKIASEYFEYIDFEGHWVADWYKYFTNVIEADKLPDGKNSNEEMIEWVNSVVDKFCRKNKIINLFNTSSLVR